VVTFCSTTVTELTVTSPVISGACGLSLAAPPTSAGLVLDLPMLLIKFFEAMPISRTAPPTRENGRAKVESEPSPSFCSPGTLRVILIAPPITDRMMT
jgi:hypothetical protein